MRKPKFDFMEVSNRIERGLGLFLGSLPLLWGGRIIYQVIIEQWPEASAALIGVVALLGALVLLILTLLLFVIWRDKKRGYGFLLSGSVEGGSLKYHEGENQIELWYDDEPFVIFIPSDEVWKRDMPEWARERKAEIVARIQQHFKRARYGEIGHIHGKWPIYSNPAASGDS